MSDGKRKCPYYSEEDKCSIMCDGVIENSVIHTYYGSQRQKNGHADFYCDKYFFCCQNASMLNQKWGRYQISACLHNRGVDCMDTTKCSTCGWHPAIAKARLLSMTK